MLPVVTIIGRPNVGKSTLFNRLTKSMAALVLDLPGTTVDRNYGFGRVGETSYIVADTAGMSGIRSDVNRQTKKAIIESKVVLFVVDAHAGVTPADLELAEILRRFSKKVILVINKIDGVNLSLIVGDFFSFGFNKIAEISAKANKGLNVLAEKFIAELKLNSDLDQELNLEFYKSYIKLAIVGQPNAGKSTLINTILNEERVLVEDAPGTTRDSIYIPTQIGEHKYMLIDTAGVRRKARVKEAIEKLSVVKTLQAIEDAQVVVLLIDAQKGIVEQDLKLVGNIVTAGKSLVLAVNKLDSISKEDQRKLFKNIEIELSFINFIKPVQISALYARGLRKMFQAVQDAFESSTKDVATNKLSLLLQQAIETHQPPLSSNGKRIKLRYAHLGGHSPFKIIIHGNQVTKLPEHYKKYLSSFFREKLQLHGTVVHIELKQSDNPYA